MRRVGRASALAGVVWLLARAGIAADSVPSAVQLPGTQPGEASGIQSVSKCDNCHQDDGKPVEIVERWSGSLMAHAARDPIFWATVAIAEQDFDGAGDLCIRCHTPEGWLDGRSTPTDGSALRWLDADGKITGVVRLKTVALNPQATAMQAGLIDSDGKFHHDFRSVPQV